EEGDRPLAREPDEVVRERLGGDTDGLDLPAVLLEARARAPQHADGVVELAGGVLAVDPHEGGDGANLGARLSGRILLGRSLRSERQGCEAQDERRGDAGE